MGIKYAVNENFFDTWNPAMAYVLGFWCADGSLEDASYLRGKYIRAASTDKLIIELIKNCLQSKHTIVAQKRELPRRTNYLLRIGSHKLFDALVSHGVTPRKSLTLLLPKIPTKYLGDFTRGYFDGDGCIYLEKGRLLNGEVAAKAMRTIFTCGSFQFLSSLEELLHEKIETSRRKIYQSQRAFQLKYGTHDSITIFKLMYKNSGPLYLPRKFDIFSKYFSIRAKFVDKEVAKILGTITTTTN